MTTPGPLPTQQAEQAPVLERHDQLPAVPPQRLQPQALRETFARWHGAGAADNAAVWLPERAGDLAPHAPRALRQASVLVPLVVREGGLQVLLTRRDARLSVHAGQISFPGGGRDPDDRDAVHTALREAEEEIGLAPAAVETLGCMPLYTTVTGFAVTPVVALVDPRAPWRPQQSEVAEVFEVPLAFLMNPAHHELRGWDTPEAAAGVPGAGPGRRVFFAMPWRDGHNGHQYFIWGATAAMIRNLYRLLIA
ncbi:CoA pyrophosphatase [Thiomonas sp.]|jgi:8-oxo-dGTP pyrophosphatase MutT (NUDIX family)|uniref:CoA pyrophosphatase n=1 Tax=Thiomonas sp. TaxID=2047785 RepID=UPI0026117077|nr:CoA pyrophosphatase [Thiomonas sp.]